MKQTILLTGGAGYIGSHTAYKLVQQGYNVVILDNLTHGQRWEHSWADCIVGDVGDPAALKAVFTQYTISAVMHFAAYAQVGISVKKPLLFYENNVAKTIKLIEAMLAHNVRIFVFSSSCAVYGIPQQLPLSEEHPCNPINPYGATKYMVERLLHDVALSDDFVFVSLRYFNAAGGLPELGLFEQHTPETHLIPLLLQAMQERKPFTLFGTTYDTPDGSCVRDYVHVVDIAQAHILALEHLLRKHPCDIFNLGTGVGFSVKQVIAMAEKVCQVTVPIIPGPKRGGDPAVLVADAGKARDILKWAPCYSDLEFMIRSAFFSAKKSAMYPESTRKDLTHYYDSKG